MTPKEIEENFPPGTVKFEKAADEKLTWEELFNDEHYKNHLLKNRYRLKEFIEKYLSQNFNPPTRKTDAPKNIKL